MRVRAINTPLVPATKLAGGIVLPGSGLGIDELGNLFVDNSHNPPDVSAGELYAESNQAAKIRIGPLVMGSVDINFASFVNRLAALHIGSSSPAANMTTSGLANGGTGATCVANGTDVSGTIVWTPGSAAWATGIQFSVAFKTAYLSAPVVLLMPTNSQAGAAGPARGLYVATTTAGFSMLLTTAATGPTPWNFSYLVIGL